jgi:diacylglycerol kinase
MNSARLRLAARLRSFVHAGRGLAVLVATQHNAWIHATATLVVLGLGLALEISRPEWALIALAVAGVWTAEALNTAFEWMCDVASPEFHPLVRRAKDVAAGGVLVAAIGASVVGLLVFGPRLLALM